MKLFALGPVPMYQRTLEIAGKQIPYFRNPEFSEIMLESEKLMKQVLFAPENAKVVFLTASGTAAMEATVMNCFTEQDKVLIIDGGIFGHRFTEICDMHRIPYDAIHLDFEEVLTEKHLDMYDGKMYTALLVNIHETSTGQLYDVRLLSEFCKRNQMYFIVDAISSFLADPYFMEDWGIDATILSTQKGLAIAPGMSVVTISNRLYEEKVLTTPSKTLYLDFRSHIDNQKRGQTPFTPAVNIAYQLNDMLRSLQEESIEHRLTHMDMIVKDFRCRIADLPIRIPNTPLSNAATPLLFKDRNATIVYETLKEKYDTVLTPCGGNLRDIMVRVGHIGNHYLDENIDLVDNLRKVLNCAK